MKKITLALMLFCSISLSAQNNSVPIEINEMFRDIEIPDTNGVKIKLSDYCAQGYYTLIEFELVGAVIVIIVQMLLRISMKNIIVMVLI